MRNIYTREPPGEVQQRKKKRSTNVLRIGYVGLDKLCGVNNV